MDLLAKFQARFSLASEGGIPPYYQEVRWAGQAAVALPPLTTTNEQKHPQWHKIKNKIKYREDFLQKTKNKKKQPSKKQS